MHPRLLLATNNQSKVHEYRSLLANLPFEIVTPAELGITTKIAEVGGSLRENAELKAKALATEGQVLALADDSGLEVDALGGEPGHMSARYAGEGASDKDRIDYLLAKLVNVPWERRSACFKCVIAIAVPGSVVACCSGECQGFITFKPRGVQGFGYDPVFYLPKLGKAMAELSFEQKNLVSHRGCAARKARRILEKLQTGG